MYQFFVGILFIYLQPSNAQPEEMFYFFDFDGLQDWTIENVGINLFTNSTSSNCADAPCWRMQGQSMATNAISTVGYHTLRIVIDVREVGLHNGESCYFQYKTASTWQNTATAVKNDNTQLNVAISIPDDNNHNNQPSFQLRVGNDGNSDVDNCYYDNLEMYGIPYTNDPTITPTNIPTLTPTISTSNPSESPTKYPTLTPTTQPTLAPTNNPTQIPTLAPTNIPTLSPTNIPTLTPTNIPTVSPTNVPTIPTQNPTYIPTNDPTFDPTFDPTNDPTFDPTNDPTIQPTPSPILYIPNMPTKAPTPTPTNNVNILTTNAVDSIPKMNTNSEAVIGGLQIVIGITGFAFCIICIIFGVLCSKKLKSKKYQKHNENMTIMGLDEIKNKPYESPVLSSLEMGTANTTNMQRLENIATNESDDDILDMGHVTIGGIAMDTLNTHTKKNSEGNGKKNESNSLIDNVTNEEESDDDILDTGHITVGGMDININMTEGDNIENIAEEGIDYSSDDDNVLCEINSVNVKATPGFEDNDLDLDLDLTVENKNKKVTMGGSISDEVITLGGDGDMVVDNIETDSATESDEQDMMVGLETIQ